MSPFSQPVASGGQRVGLSVGDGGVGLERLLVGQVERLGQLGGWDWSLDTGQTHWSPYLYDLFGLDPAGPPPGFSHGETLFTAATWPRLKKAIDATLASGGGFEVEVEF